MEKESLRLLKILSAVVLGAIILLSAATYWFYRNQELEIRDRAFAELQAIGELKANEIMRWRAERLADAKVLIEGRFLQEAVYTYSETPTADGATFLLERFNGIRRHYEYDELNVIDRSGRVFLSTSAPAPAIAPPAEALEQAFALNEPVFTDIHGTRDDLGPHLGIIAPLPSFPNPSTPPTCAIVLICRASRYLYPMIQAWPTASQTAETLLVRPEGDRVLYLNDVRHRPGAALNYSVLKTDPGLASTHAVQGFKGVIEGSDYRGIRVLAYVCSIPNTTWSMVAKQDAAEVFVVWRLRSRIILALFIVMVLGVLGMGAALLSRNHRNHYKALYRYENEIRETLEKYRITLNAIADAVIATDCEGRVEFLNPAAETMTGWDNAEAIGSPLDSVFNSINEKTRQAVESPVVRALRGDGSVPLTNQTLLIAKDRVERPISHVASLIYDQTSQVSGVVLVFRDQTVEQNYKLLFQKMRSGFASHTIICDPSGTPVDYRFIDVNPAFEELTGLHAKDIVGKTVLEALPGTEPEWIERYGCVALTGEPIHFEQYTKSLGKFFKVSAYPTLPNQFATIISDVTAIKQDEAQRIQKNEQLRRLNKDLARVVASNERLATAIEQSQDAVVITDAEANILYINKTFEQVTGYARDEVLGQNPRILQSGKHEPAFYEEMWRELQSGHPVFIQFINKRKDGTLYTEEASLSPVLDVSGEIVNYVGVKRDITERLKMEERLNQTQKMETVGRLAGGVAHDFNNMLGVILGNAELLKSKLIHESPLREEVEAIINAAKRSAEITRQLLAFARKQVIHPRTMDMNEAVEHGLKLLRRLIGENIELVWKPFGSACYVKMDAVQIDQILTNLCVNSRDAINGIGTIAIETSAVTLSAQDCEPYKDCEPGDYIVLSVTDTGAGMPPDVLEHVFEPFFSKKALGDGTGLGLATVDGIVSQNGGFIVPESQPGAGTTFRIYLPEQTEPKAVPDASSENETPRGKGETVLIVEDEEMLLKLSAAMLRSLGYQVFTALTPATAIKLAKEHAGTLDLLLSDVVMSDMNGKELADQICAIHSRIRVMFMSGYTADIIASQGVLDASVHFISKPFTRNELAIKLREALLADKPPVRAL